jgi:hypothetical protein
MTQEDSAAGAVTPGAVAICAETAEWRLHAGGQLVVAIDGYGGSGKTTIAGEAALALGARLVATDSALRHPPEPTRDPRPLAAYYDWAELRLVALRPAIASRAPLVIVEGVTAAAPALADLVTHTVFVDTPEPVRLARLRARISPGEWDEGWLEAEREYFTSRPAASFDLVVAGY